MKNIAFEDIVPMAGAKYRGNLERLEGSREVMAPHCAAKMMPDPASTRDRTQVGRGPVEEVLAVSRNAPPVRRRPVNIGGSSAAHVHVPGPDQAFRVARKSMAPARKACGSSLPDPVIDAEVHRVPGIVRASKGGRAHSPTRKFVPADCVPGTPPSGIPGPSLNEVIP